jgi:hypothetical protein
MKQVRRYRRALKGLEGLTAWVHDVPEQASDDGLSRQHLQDVVVVKLLDAGIKTLGIGNVPEPPGNPWLNIFVNAIRWEDYYFYFLTVRLDEVVRLDRNSSIKTFAATWEHLARGLIPVERMPQEVEKALDSLLDYFIYDYMHENRSE